MGGVDYANVRASSLGRSGVRTVVKKVRERHSVITTYKVRGLYERVLSTIWTNKIYLLIITASCVNKLIRLQVGLTGFSWMPANRSCDARWADELYQSEDLPEFAGNTGFTDERCDQIYFSDTSQYQCAIPSVSITQYHCTRLSVTPAKHTPKQYHSHSNTQ